jgi:hypothetical protein
MCFQQQPGCCRRAIPALTCVVAFQTLKHGVCSVIMAGTLMLLLLLSEVLAIGVERG